MRIPAIEGVIRRRILANFRVDPGVMQRQLPEPFRPKLLDRWALAGICLIRLEGVRPKGLPLPVGIASENAAHRVAVRWTDAAGVDCEGVYVRRRDTDHWLNALAGGRIFPGVHHHARFAVEDRDGRIDWSMHADDGVASVRVVGREADALPDSSRFGSVEEAASFFANASDGYSATGDPGRLDGLELAIDDFRVRPLAVELVESSEFDDRSRYPAGSVEFDCALLMRDVPHVWRGLPDLTVPAASGCEG